MDWVRNNILKFKASKKNDNSTMLIKI